MTSNSRTHESIVIPWMPQPYHEHQPQRPLCLLANPKGLRVYIEWNWLPQAGKQHPPSSKPSTAQKKKQAASLCRCHVAIIPVLWTGVLRWPWPEILVCPWARWEPRGDTPGPRLEVLKAKSPSSSNPFLVSRRGEGEGQEMHLESAQFVGFSAPWHHLFSHRALRHSKPLLLHPQVLLILNDLYLFRTIKFFKKINRSVKKLKNRRITGAIIAGSPPLRHHSNLALKREGHLLRLSSANRETSDWQKEKNPS